MWVLKRADERELNIFFNPGVRIEFCPGRVVATPTRKQQLPTTKAFRRHMLGGKLLLRQSINRECRQANRARVNRMIVQARTHTRERFRPKIKPLALFPLICHVSLRLIQRLARTYSPPQLEDQWLARNLRRPPEVEALWHLDIGGKTYSRFRRFFQTAHRALDS